MSAPREVDVLLVGGGPASESCARTLREEGADGSILLVGREMDPPSDRTVCSKDYLRGDLERTATYLHPPEWWAQQGIELLTRTSVLKLHPAEQMATLSTKEQVRYGQALLATGANVRRLTAENSDLDGIHYIRALGNADALRRDVAEASEVVLVGGSYIGCEVAATLTQMGRRCTVVMQEEVTLEHHLGRDVGRVVQETLEDHGIRFVAADSLDRYEGHDEQVTGVMTASGRELPADAVVVGVGANPDVMLARAAGLELGERGGVSCDAGLRASAPGLFAAGDMCEYLSDLHGGPARIEHWNVAVDQGRTAARNMLGRDEQHRAVPSFWSDLADWLHLDFVGPIARWDQEATRGSLADRTFSHWYLSGGRVVGAVAAGRSDDLEHAARLVAAGGGTDVDPARLADPETDLATV